MAIDRLTVDRHGLNIYGTPRRAANPKLLRLTRQKMKEEPVLLKESQRAVVKMAINEVCDYRRYDLKAINVRTNHAHVVVTAQSKPEPIVDAFKSYSTRRLRDAGLIAGKSVRGRVAGVVVTCGNLSTFCEQSTMCFMGKAISFRTSMTREFAPSLTVGFLLLRRLCCVPNHQIESSGSNLAKTAVAVKRDCDADRGIVTGEAEPTVH